MKILLVDDKKENLYLLEKLLQGNGYETLSAANGAAALALALKNPPDMIVSDILMPVMDGFTLCREWRKNKILKKIPFVFYTATYTDPKDEEFALSLGADRFIIKPQGVNDFLQILKETFDAYKTQEQRPAPLQISEDQVFLKEYNETLVRRLEEKMERVEAAEKELREKNAVLEQDIEERKHAEEVLRESEERYRSLFENMVEGYAYCKMLFENGQPSDFVYLKTNQTFGKLTGLKNVEGKKVSEVIPGLQKSDPELLKTYGRVALTGKPERFEAFVESLKDWYSVSVYSPMKEYFVAVFDVITERKRAEVELSKSEEKYRSIFENVQDVYYETLIDGTILEVSPSIEIASKGQYKRDDIIGKSMYDFYSDAGIRRILLTLLHERGTVSDFEIAMRNRDGSLIPCSTSAKISFDAEGHPQKIIGSMREITQRKQAEDALRETRDYLENLLSFANAPIIVWDPDLKITRFNMAIEKLTGYTIYDVIGKHLEILFPTENRKSSLALIASTSEGDHLIAVEIPILSKNGNVHTVLWSTANIYATDGETLISTIAQGQDITEQKKLQQKLIQSQKMESIGTLAGGIAHDFNNILGIILGYSSIIERKTMSPEKLHESLEVINNAVGRGAALVRQILTFARKTDVVFEAMSVPDLILELLSMLKQTFPKVITFTEMIHTDIPYIIADRTQIHQVMLNLCVNARDAMPNGGTIAIKAEKQTKEQVQKRIPAADQDSYICISVTDTGEGMSEATRRQIFDPFFTTKEKGKGTGLGLAVVYGAMQSHHGFVDVESEVERGTTFRLYFPIPLENKQSIDVSSSTESFTIGGTETILLVEDEEALLEMVRFLLESKGYKVLTAHDGNEAINVYKQHTQEIDIVLTDIGLPGMMGTDVFKKLREFDPNVKVVAASGFFDTDMKSKLEKAGAKGFIQKPYSPDEVLQILRKVLDAKSE